MYVDDWLDANDIRLFLNRVTLPKARKEYNEQAEVKISKEDFRDAVTDHCRFWKNSRRKPERKVHLLREPQWEELGKVVRQMHCFLKGRTLSYSTDYRKNFTYGKRHDND